MIQNRQLIVPLNKEEGELRRTVLTAPVRIAVTISILIPLIKIMEKPALSWVLTAMGKTTRGALPKVPTGMGSFNRCGQ
jgi:hypothetical protein